MFPGTKITIKGEDFVVPALSLGQLRNGANALMQQHDELLADGKVFESMDIRGKVILEALRRNYPDFEEAALFDFLDMANTTNLWLKILGQSGFEPGETPAAQTATGLGTSSPSTEA